MALNATVMVLDDEPLIRLMISSTLEQAGAMVSDAGNCAEALELARNTSFDAAVFDHRLPDGGGLDLVRMLRREGIGFPVVMLSGESVDIWEDASEVEGVVAVCSKPPDMEMVVQALGRATGKVANGETMRVGRYVYCRAEAIEADSIDDWQDVKWLAIDVSNMSGAAPHPTIVDCIRLPRQGGVAVLGADQVIRRHLDEEDVEIEFVSNVEELAAVSRRPSSPSERAALIGVPIQ